MHQLKLLVLITALISTFAQANNISNGQPLPFVAIEKHGELTLEGDNVGYQDWNSHDLTDKIRIVQAIAGRSNAKAMNAPLIEAITEANFPNTRYQTTTIINQNDSIWGTGGFVKSSAEDSKREFSWSSMVLDETGAVSDAWHLKANSSTIIVIDQLGIVHFVKEGELNDTDINQVIELVRTLI